MPLLPITNSGILQEINAQAETPVSADLLEQRHHDDHLHFQSD